LLNENDTIMKRSVFLALFFVTLSAGLHAQQQQQCDTTVIRADTAAFRAMLEKRNGIVIDVRRPEEWKTGYIKGAINIDYVAKDFEQRIAKLDKNKTYYVYCEVGGRSAQAAAYMKSQGFCKVVVLERGLKQWKEAGYPVVIPKK
jgi:rhodanese-related sulfurtransferase